MVQQPNRGPNSALTDASPTGTPRTNTIPTDATLRSEGRAAFDAQGLPRTRTESWRYFPTRHLRDVDMTGGGDGNDDDALDDALVGRSLIAEAAALPGVTGIARAVFVDGRMSAGHSSLRGLPAGLVVGDLSEHLAAGGAGTEFLGQAVGPELDGLAAANAANFRGGAFVHATKNVVVEDLLELVFISSEGSVHHGRHLVVLEPGSQLTISARFVGLGAGAKLANHVTELIVGDNAGLRWFKTIAEGRDATHVDAIGAKVSAHGRLTTFALSVGGKAVRTATRATLIGEGAECVLDGLYVGGPSERIDNLLICDHQAGRTTSGQHFTGIMNDGAVGTFQGTVFIREAAVKCSTRQLSRNLLLGPGAVANTKPQLEIDNDDVIASHGSTVGQLDHKALFYLQSRGLSPKRAEAVLTFAFAREALDIISDAALRGSLIQQVARLMGSDGLDAGGELELDEASP